VKKKTKLDKTLPMKSCPTCEAKFEEEIIRFCTKCGTPLLTENQPSFTALPSQASIKIDNDKGEETVVVRRKPSNTVPLEQPKLEQPQEEIKQRIVVPISAPESIKPQANRAFQSSQSQPAKKSNTALTVLLTLFGTLTVIGGGFGVWYFLTSENSPNSNMNANKVANTINQNTTNVNTNVEIDNSNYNFNANSVSNVNIGTISNANTTTSTNTNLKTPKPTPKPTIKPISSNANVNANSVANVNTNASVNRPTNSANVKLSPTPTPSPKPTITPTNTTPKNVSVGNMTGRALSLPKPAFPSNARQAGANGQVIVQIIVDQNGNVLSAKATSGHPLLRSPAENAARQARFAPNIGGESAKVSGTVTYNFQIQ
jgi:TonB family protein